MNVEVLPDQLGSQAEARLCLWVTLSILKG
jgi:hypothetical protein